MKHRTGEGKQALIVAHGWPKHPAVLEAEIAWLSNRVERHLPGWKVRSATLAAPNALSRAVSASDPDSPLTIYPFFMADGWFVSDYLRERLSQCAKRDLVWCAPFGLINGLVGLCENSIQSGDRDFAIDDATLITVAHGSPDKPRPAEIARDLTEALVQECGFRAGRTGFVDESPYLEEVLEINTPAICLPLFASHAGHVREDLPAAVLKSGYRGAMLPVVGSHTKAPELIANTLRKS